MAANRDVASAAPTHPAHGWVLGVLGATGGVGASSVAGACAVRAGAANVRSVVVDTSPYGGGLDLAVGLDGEPGLRWRDLAGASGRLDGRRLLAELPSEGGCAVLSWDRREPPASHPGPEPVLSALRSACDVVVIDLPRAGVTHAEHWARACDSIVLVVGGGVTDFAGAAMAAETVPAAAVVLRVVRGGTPVDVLEAALGLPVIARLGHDDQVVADLVRGEPVGRGGGMAAAADRVLARLLPVPAEAAV